MRVIGYATLPWGATVDLCARHARARAGNLMQVQHGVHEGTCFDCETADTSAFYASHPFAARYDGEE